MNKTKTDSLPKCYDGTLYNKCSKEKPNYCYEGKLIQKAATRGCPNDYNYKIEFQSCKKIDRCSDGTIYGECSDNKPIYCENGTLINKSSKCRCFLGEKAINEECKSESEIVSSCKQEFEKYANIGSSKFGVKININDIKFINSKTEAREFYNLYSEYSLFGTLNFDNFSSLFPDSFTEYPLIMISGSFTYQEPLTLPFIVICDKNGKMKESSIKKLTG